MMSTIYDVIRNLRDDTMSHIKATTIPLAERSVQQEETVRNVLFLRNSAARRCSAT